MEKYFSPVELKVLKILGKKKLTIDKITKEYFKGLKAPISPNNTIAGSVRRINKKAEFHGLKWFINGDGLGRRGKTVWKQTI